MKIAGENLEESVKLYDSDKYFSTLGVYHGLHCQVHFTLLDRFAVLALIK